MAWPALMTTRIRVAAAFTALDMLLGPHAPQGWVGRGVQARKRVCVGVHPCVPALNRVLEQWALCRWLECK